MDFSIIEHFIPNLAKWLNLDPATVLFLIIGISSAANLISRRIPDDVVGWKGTVRDICGVIGLYASNRVTRGVSTNDIVKSVVGIGTTTAAAAAVTELAKDDTALIPAVADLPPPVVENTFGRFAENYKEEINEAEGPSQYPGDLNSRA